MIQFYTFAGRMDKMVEDYGNELGIRDLREAISKLDTYTPEQMPKALSEMDIQYYKYYGIATRNVKIANEHFTTGWGSAPTQAVVNARAYTEFCQPIITLLREVKEEIERRIPSAPNNAPAWNPKISAEQKVNNNNNVPTLKK